MMFSISLIKINDMLLTLYCACYFIFPFKIKYLDGLISSWFLVVLIPIALYFNLHESRYIKKVALSILGYLILFLTINFYFNNTAFALLKTYFYIFATIFFILIVGKNNSFTNLKKSAVIYIVASFILVCLEIFLGSDYYYSNLLSDQQSIYRLASGFGLNSLHGIGLTSIAFLVLSFDENFIKKKALVKMFLVFCYVSFFYLSMSRSIWLSLLLTFSFISIYKILFFRNYEHAKIFGMIIAFFLLMLAVPKDYFYNSKLVKAREIVNLNLNRELNQSDLDEGYTLVDRSKNLRLLAYGLSFELIKDNYLLGIGIGKFPDYFSKKYSLVINNNIDKYGLESRINTHNTYLSILVEQGVLVGGLFVFLLLFIFYGLFALKKIDNQDLMFFSCFLFMFIWNMYIDLSRDRIFYIFMALALTRTVFFKSFKNTEQGA